MELQFKELKSQLQKIIESTRFSRSNVNVALLNLLFNSTIEGKKLKETTIGTEIFGKNYDPIKNDTKVRVYVHNLRKKLAEYYEESEETDEIIFEIEKGQYQISFRKPQPKAKTFGSRSMILGLLLIVLSIISVWVFVVSPRFKQTPLWGSFKSNKFPFTVLIGDHFTVEAKVPTGGTGVFRDFAINSKQEFSEYISKNPENAPHMLPNRYPYITKMGVYCSKSLSGFFYNKGVSFDLMLKSEWDNTRINSENVIYAGQFKTMGFLKELFLENYPHYNIENSSIRIINKETGDQMNYNSETGEQVIDYTLVSLIKGFQGNEILLFASDHDVGVIHMVDYFTNEDSVKAFYNRHHIDESGFSAVFKVSGWERTGLSMELMSVESK